jgi:hypothetical protein
MFRFTIRDVLWLMVVVGIGTTWLLDRDRIQRHRIAMAKHEAELISRAKMWENEAGRAEQRYADIRERFNALEGEMRMRGTKKLSENDISAGYRDAIGCGQPDFILEESQAWTPCIRVI